MSHIRRGDWWIQTTAELLRAVCWFNPLIWILCRRLRVESEYACDDAVLAQGVTGPEYAAHLLDIVCLLQITDRPWSSALGMASPSTIERRFAAMLNPRTNRRSISRLGMLVIAITGLCVTLPLAALTTSARVQVQTHEPVTAIPNTALTSGRSAQPQAPAVRPPSRELTKAVMAATAGAASTHPASGFSSSRTRSATQQSQYRGEKISLNVNGLSLISFFKLIGETSGLNVVIDPDVSDMGTVTLRLTDIPWDQALDIVLRQNSLIGQLDGNVLRIRQAPTPAPESITMDFEIYRMVPARFAKDHNRDCAWCNGGKGGPGSDLKITATPSR
jgi:hypothetical protein